MSKLKKGNNVKVHYTGKIKDGEVFDSSLEREPFGFKIGQNEVIPGFEESIMDLEIGESTTVNIEAKDAYGDHHPQMVQEVLTDNLPEGHAVGLQVQGTGPNGEPVVATITEINENVDYTDPQGNVQSGKNVAKIDFNHPLAGKDLTFDIELIEVTEDTENADSTEDVDSTENADSTENTEEAN